MKVKYILAPKLSRFFAYHAYDYTAFKKFNHVLILHMCNIFKVYFNHTYVANHERYAKNKYAIIYTACRQCIR